MGKTKIKIQKIEKESNRRVTFNKRKIGLLKKAYEISILCDVDIALIFSSQNGEMTCFEGPRSSVEEVVMKFANIPDHERAKSHIQKYTTDEDQVSNAAPRKIENEQMFQAVARKLFESHPGSIALSESNSRSIQMDHLHRVRRQEIIEEIKDIQRFIGLYDLSLPIEDLVSSSKDAIQMEFYVKRQLQKLQNFKIMSSPLPAALLYSQKDNRTHEPDQNFEPIYIKQEYSEADENVKMENPMLGSLYIKQEYSEADENVKTENPMLGSLITDVAGSTYIKQELGATNVDDTTYVLGGWNNLSLDMGLLDDGGGTDDILSLLPALSESSSDFLSSSIEDDIIDQDFFKDNYGHEFFQKDSGA